MIAVPKIAIALVALSFTTAVFAAPAPAAVVHTGPGGVARIARRDDPDPMKICLDKPVCPAEGVVE